MNNRTTAAIGFTLSLMHGLAIAQAPSNEELYQIIQAQQAELDKLQGAERDHATGRTHIGGYGELHYNNLSLDDGSNDRELDFHRFVLFFGHQFSDRISFHSELELEHSLAGDGKPGEVELEQAYLEFNVSDRTTARGGLFLLPVGILNETHEPPTFYGVERNDVESILIPATWWAGGAAIGTRWDTGLSLDFAVHEGLAVPTSGGSAFRIRSGRQKTAEANASDLAYTARIKYSGIPGFEAAASLQYQTDISQNAGDGLDEGLLYTAHVVLQKGAFGLRALYAGWDLGGTAVAAANMDSQKGWYLEPSLRLNPRWGIYARYEDLDAARTQDRFSQWELGTNFWPHEQVVLKLDLRSREHDLAVDSGRDFDGFDLGIGYHF